MTDLEGRVSRIERTFAQLKGGGLVLAVVVLAFMGITSVVYIPDKVTATVDEKINKEVDEAIEKEIRDKINNSKSVAQSLSSAVQTELESQLPIRLKKIVPDTVDQEIQKKLPPEINQVISKIYEHEAIAGAAASKLSELAIKYDRHVEVGVVGMSEKIARGVPPGASFYEQQRGITKRGIVNGRVSFSVPFRSTPTVMIGLKMLDVGKNANARVDVSVTSVDLEGFNYTLYTWGDTTIYAAEAAWMLFDIAA